MTNFSGGDAIRFSSTANKDFDTTLQKRVRDYFKENKLSRYANANMVFKTVFMLSLYLVPYLLMVTGIISNIWLIVFMWILMGVGMAGIGMGVMHDANHGAYSKHDWVNKVIGRIIILVGGFAANWKIQHNILHHSYTNIDGFDEDIVAPMGLMRFSPNEKRKPIHRFQHLYAWFFYGFLTVSWSTFKDFNQIWRYKKMGLTNTQSSNFAPLLIELVINKLVYYGFIVVLPLIFLDLSWWQILICIVIMHFTAGLILSTVFQLAHVVPDTNFPQAAAKMDDTSSVHQLKTTANFAPKSRLMNWFIGGLNFQVEHHLFPTICHVHYKNLSKIVQRTAQEFGIPYHSEKNLVTALASHTRMLKQLGQK